MTLISAFIIAKNEEARIGRAIKSLHDVADEVIVIDSGSSDNTVSIAEGLGARVVYNEWKGYVPQKIFGESLCKHKWILNIDADEEISHDLSNEIGYIFKGKIQDRYKAYRMRMVIMHHNETIPRRYAPDTVQIRLYNREYASFANARGSEAHDAVLLNDGIPEKRNIYMLNEPVYHYSSTSIEQLVAKANFYSSEQVSGIISNGREISRFRICVEFFVYFFKAFFIRRYFVFGFDGFVDSIIFGFGGFLRLAKAREAAKRNDKLT